MRDDRGQSTVELALLLPLLLMLVFGMVDLGTAYHHSLSIGAATREGARVAGALVNGGGPLGCGSGGSPNAATVDPNVIAAVERVLTGTGATVKLADVTEIRIYKAVANGDAQGNLQNPWTYAPAGGPVVGGETLNFSITPQNEIWRACQRSNATPVDSVGVSLRYTYRSRTPLGWLVPGLATIQMTDRTVMALNASK